MHERKINLLRALTEHLLLTKETDLNSIMPVYRQDVLFLVTTRRNKVISYFENSMQENNLKSNILHNVSQRYIGKHFERNCIFQKRI